MVGDASEITSAIMAFGLALVHLFAGPFLRLRAIPRSPWLSFAGGTSVAYVFVHLLPELAHHQATLVETIPGWLGMVERHAYLFAVAGFVAFYGLERLALLSQGGERKSPERPSKRMYHLHLVFFSLYNALIGYSLLHLIGRGQINHLLYFLAVALHLVVVDDGLRQHHKEVYHRHGRWQMAAAVLAGWLIGLLVGVQQAAVGLIFAFLAGSITLNVIKEELPEERESRFTAFALGAGGYSVLLLFAV